MPYVYWGQWIALELNPFGFILMCLAGLYDAVICVQALKKTFVMLQNSGRSHVRRIIFVITAFKLFIREII